jgi:hypothetical protein
MLIQEVVSSKNNANTGSDITLQIIGGSAPTCNRNLDLGTEHTICYLQLVADVFSFVLLIAFKKTKLSFSIAEFENTPPVPQFLSFQTAY